MMNSTPPWRTCASQTTAPPPTPSDPPAKRASWRSITGKSTAIAAAILALATGGASAATGIEALINRSFENGTTPWVGNYWGGTSAIVAATPENPARTGNYVHRLSGTSSNGFTVAAQPVGLSGNGTLGIPAGAIVHCGAWFRVPDASPDKPADVRVRPRCNATGVGTSYNVLLTSPNWTFVGDDGTGDGIVMPANDWLDFRVYGPSDRTVYVDDTQCLVDAPAITGTVALQGGASPVGTRVILKDAFDVVIATRQIDNTAGTFAFALPNGDYGVSLSKFGYYPQSRTANIDGGDAALSTITLNARAVATVSGTVTYQGVGVPGVTVRASQYDDPGNYSESAPTSADGSYSLLAEAGVEYELSAPAGLPPMRVVDTVPDPFTPADASPITGKNITLGKGPIVYNFDDGTLQGWTNVGGGTNQFISRNGGDPGTGYYSPNFVGVDNWDARDSTTSTLWLRSPSFVLDSTGDLSFYLFGGQGSGAATLPANESGIATGEGATNPGFIGVALRDNVTGDFVLVATRPSSGGPFQQVGFTQEQLAAATIPGREYTLDLIDLDMFDWGWIALDSVAIPGTPGVPPAYTTISGTVNGGGAGIVVRAGTLSTTTQSDGSFSFTNAIVGRSYTLTLTKTSLPVGKAVGTAPATFTATETANTGKDFTLIDDPDFDPELLFAARSNDYSGTGNWTPTYPAGAMLNRIATPETTTINGQKWVTIQRGSGGDDGFELAGIPNLGAGTDVNGVSIVVAVRPYYPINVGGEARGEIVSMYYNGLVLASDHDTGEVMIARKAWDWRRTGYRIPNGQITILSLVVQLDGSCKLYANGTEVWTGAAIGDNAYDMLQGTDPGWMTRTGVGRNPWDGWSSFNGLIGDVRVYKTAIADSKRTALETEMINRYGTAGSFTITATAGPGGTIDPAGEVSVPEGAGRTFTVTPDKYFAVTSVLLDEINEVLTSPNKATYTIANVSANGSIAASFTEWTPTFITGKVATSDGTGVAGLIVTANGGREPYTAVSSDGTESPLGTFSIRVQPGVEYTLTCVKPGWEISPASYTVTSDSLTDKNFTATFKGPQRLIHLVVEPEFSNDAPLTRWPNRGTLGGQFIADGGWDTVAPTTRASIGGSKAVEFNGSKMLLSSTESSNDKILAPANITGPGSNFTVLAKLYDDSADIREPWEQFFLAWSRRNGPDGTCASFGYGKGWWGAIGGWGWGDTNYGALIPGTDRTVVPEWSKWNAVAMTSDGTNVKIYYNGELVNSVDKVLNWHPNMPISLGAQYWGDAGQGREIAFSGGMTELMIYDMALTAEQIAALSAFASPDDTDADGLPDAWEMTAVGNLTSLTRTGDFDRDGTSDTAEYRLGLTPNDPASFFKVTINRDPVTGDVTLTWPSKENLEFVIQYSEDISLDNAWQDLANITDFDGGNSESFTDIGISDTPRLFYRVALKP